MESKGFIKKLVTKKIHEATLTLPCLVLWVAKRGVQGAQLRVASGYKGVDQSVGSMEGLVLSR